MNIVLTGERPTGRLHIGHYVGSLQQRLQLQDDRTHPTLTFFSVQARPRPHAREV